MIGENIKNLRNNKNLTQEQLAKKCNLSKNAIWNYERGDRSPNVDKLMKIAAVLDVSVDDLLSEDLVNLKTNKEHLLSLILTKDLINELHRRLEGV